MSATAEQASPDPISLDPVVILRPEQDASISQLTFVEPVVRLLGNASLEDTPQDLYRHVVGRGSNLKIGEEIRLAHLIRTLAPPSVSGQARRVSSAVDMYYGIFHSWDARIPPERLEHLRQDYLNEQIDRAKAANTVAIIGLTALRAQFAETTTPQAVEAVDVVIASHGLVTSPDAVTTRMTLLRKTDNVHNGYRLDKPTSPV